jgi:hypothetical protein
MRRVNKPLWQSDAYLANHANALYDLQVLQGLELNEVQMSLLSIRNFLFNAQKQEEQKQQFLENLYVADEARYFAYKDVSKQEEKHDDLSGVELDSVEWQLPTSAEEIKSLEAEFKKMHEDHLKMLEEAKTGNKNLDWLDLNEVRD